jgi:Family of unknown function (DUF6221)
MLTHLSKRMSDEIDPPLRAGQPAGVEVVTDFVELIRFVRDNLDADERVASLAKPGPWSWRDRFFGAKTFHSLVSEVDHGAEGTLGVWEKQRLDVVLPSAISDIYPNRYDAEHIARQNPKATLDRVRAQRRMVDGYEQTVRIRDEAAGRIHAAWHQGPTRKDLDDWSRAQYEVAILDEWVQALACQWPNVEGFRKEWWG